MKYILASIICIVIMYGFIKIIDKIIEFWEGRKNVKD